MGWNGVWLIAMGCVHTHDGVDQFVVPNARVKATSNHSTPSAGQPTGFDHTPANQPRTLIPYTQSLINSTTAHTHSPQRRGSFRRRSNESSSHGGSPTSAVLGNGSAPPTWRLPRAATTGSRRPSSCTGLHTPRSIDSRPNQYRPCGPSPLPPSIDQFDQTPNPNLSVARRATARSRLPQADDDDGRRRSEGMVQTARTYACVERLRRLAGALAASSCTPSPRPALSFAVRVPIDRFVRRIEHRSIGRSIAFPQSPQTNTVRTPRRLSNHCPAPHTHNTIPHRATKARGRSCQAPGWCALFGRREG